MPEPTLTAAAALDVIEEGVLVQDAEQILYANRAAGELLGMNREQLRGPAQLVPPCDCVSDCGGPLAAEAWPVAEALRTGRPQRPRIVGIKRPEGGLRWVRVSARPFGDSVLTSLQDITALRRAQEEVAALATRVGAERESRGVLSPREHEVVELLAAGLTGYQVAEQLGISPATVRVHIRNATGKLGASTRTQAVAMAVALGEVCAPVADG
ncbi:MAG TPA: PAS and helix-turn-helix domain-containing protein [Solirubrobacteraceae bacterium]